MSFFSIPTTQVSAESNFIFNNNLKMGMTHPDVKELQKFLNGNGYPVSLSGVGSLGNETTYFGLKTKSAVMLFQTAKGLTPDGSVGPMTRSYLNNPSPTDGQTPSSPTENPPSNPNGQTSTGCTLGALFNTITGQPCSTTPPPTASTYPAGCTSTSGFSVTTGLSCGTTTPTPTITYPAGCTSTSGFSVTTGVSCATGLPTTPVTTTIIAPTIVSGGGSSSHHYTQLTIANPTLTLSKTYDGSTTAEVTAGALSGVDHSDTVTVTALATYDNKNVGTGKTITVVYTIGGADASSYIKPVNYTVATGEITAKDITVTADSSQTKVYGATDPTFTYTTPGLVGTDTLSGALSRASGSNVGTYAITIGTLANTNYDITFVPANFSITTKAITVTANSSQTKVYGAVDPTFTYGASPALESGDVFTGTLSRATGENVGTYAITEGDLSAGTNYAVTFVPANFSITTKPITVTADSSQTKVYGATDPTFTYTTPGLVGADTLSGALSRAAGSNVGTYAITIGTLANTNYDITLVSADFSITKKSVIVTPNASQTKVYGEVDPTFTYTVDALVGGDTLTGSLDRASGSNVGAYAIGLGTVTTANNANYTVSLFGTPVNFSITKKSVIVTPNASQTKVYGEVDPTFTYTVDALVEGDTLTGSLDRASGSNVGTYAIGLGTVTTANNANYTVSLFGTPVNFSITQKSLTVTAVTDSKTYDGGTTSDGVPTVGDLVAGDTVNVAPTQAYDNKNIGTTHTMTASGLTIKDGASSDMTANYNITYTPNTTGVITSIQLTITNPTLTTEKQYDRSTSATVTAGTLVGVVDGGVTVTGVANYETPNIGTNKTITTVYTLDGENAGNYIKPVNHISYAGNITAKQLTISAPSFPTNPKVYDGDNTTTVNIGTLTGIASGETVTVTGVATYDTKNVGTGKTITTVYTIGGADSANYIKPVDGTSATGEITQKSLTVTAVTDSKTYDGGTTSDGVPTVGDLVAGDTVNVVPTQAYDNKNVGTTHTMTASGLTIKDGASANMTANYNISYVTNTTGTILTRAITVTADSSQTKVYGAVDPTFTYGVSPALESGDVFTGTLSRAVGETVATYAITQGSLLATNYAITFVPANFSITQKQLTIASPTLTLSKPYDGGTTAVVTAGALGGKVGADDVSIDTTVATYDNDNIGTGKTITVVYTITGANASQYIKPVDYTTTSGVITALQLTITNPTLTTTKEYNRSTTAAVTAGTLSGVIGVEDVTVTGVANYETPNIGTSKTITTVYTLGGADAGNYIKPVNYLSYAGIITAKQLTISAPTLTPKPYDGDTTASVTAGSLIGVADTEVVTVGAVSTYANAEVGTDKTITTVYTIGGADAANYIKPVNGTDATGVITQKQLTIAAPTALTLSKSYDGNTTVATCTAGALSGIVGSETVTATCVATYDNSSVGTGKTITIVYTLGGAQAGNYIKPVDGTDTNGVITAIVINTAAIAGVTAPVAGATAVATLADGMGYSATISWSPSAGTFAGATVYTATITLTAKIGYTLTGVTANFFTVAGTSTPATNSADSGVITAVFPATATPLVSIGTPTGTTTVDSVLTAGSLTPAEATVSYQWKSATTSSGTYSDIGGATSSTYTLVSTDLGKYIKVSATGTGGYSGTVTSTATAVILATFTYNGGSFTYGIVTNPTTGKTWLDRNLGATRVAQSSTDSAAYGDLFQWGRKDDGHQTRTSATTGTLSTTDDTTGNSSFILPSSLPNDWRSDNNNNRWNTTPIVNNPCPSGFRVPTETEFDNERLSWSSNNMAGAFASPLKLTVAGRRSNSDGSLTIVGIYGFYWLSSIDGTDSHYLNFFGSNAYMTSTYRAYGFTVRCIAE